MKIGIFDSGLGGLIVARAIRQAMPEYDYVYLGDTKRVPYGTRSAKTVFEFSRECIEYLFKKQKCALVVVACNTVSSQALSRLAREFGPERIYGVLLPAARAAAEYGRIGILATPGTVASGAFPKEIKKINSRAEVFQSAAPMLVPLAEAGEQGKAQAFVLKYLRLLPKKMEALVLGCTHYPVFKNQIRKIVGRKTKVISQDEIVPRELEKYLREHPEIEEELSEKRTVKILVTDRTATIDALTSQWFGKVKPKLTEI